MNQVGDREIVRDSYNYKICEIIRTDERISIFDYGSRRFLGREEIFGYFWIIKEISQYSRDKSLFL
jgi:hypothetical protein